ncbi:hypothetical protein K438DRAFT_1762054 [Mycena galopus ATCC 62051]|nr:hypothetical protein K438DRAFT_1762054 [Mycena galopus ATCC 62051]
MQQWSSIEVVHRTGKLEQVLMQPGELLADNLPGILELHAAKKKSEDTDKPGEKSYSVSLSSPDKAVSMWQPYCTTWTNNNSLKSDQEPAHINHLEFPHVGAAKCAIQAHQVDLFIAEDAAGPDEFRELCENESAGCPESPVHYKVLLPKPIQKAEVHTQHFSQSVP